MKLLQDSHDTILVLTDNGAARMSRVCPVTILQLHNIGDYYLNAVISTDTQLHLKSDTYEAQDMWFQLLVRE